MGLVSHQPIEVNGEVVLFYMTAGMLLSCLVLSMHAVDSCMICESTLSEAIGNAVKMCILYPAPGLFKEILNKAFHQFKGVVSTCCETEQK